VLPGDGIIDLPDIFGALEAGGVVGWFDLEIFSDDGSFTEEGFEDSLWQQDPLDVIRRGKAGFEKAWAARKAPA
jgi:sugar phosphate isomerase/epimerase